MTSNLTETIAASEIKAWSRSADVVIVGQGVAGACSALEAHRAGAKVLVIERASGGGGTSATSEGIFYLGGGTAVQRACGYEDDAEQLFAFLRASTSAEDDKLRLFSEGSAAHFDWLEAQGVPFARKAFTGKAVSLKTGEGLLTTGNEKAWPWREKARPAPRGHQATPASATSGSGAAAMAALLARCADEGVEALYDAQALALIVDDGGRVVGVRVRVDGAMQDVQATRAVILATGSFNANAEMVRENVPQISPTSLPIGIPYNDGSGIRLGQSAGGAVESMGGIIATASIYPPAQLIKGVIVNARGERFTAEDVYHGRLASFVMEQPGQTAYLIVDAEIFAYPEAARAQHRLVDGWETVSEMEAGLGLPKGSLTATLARYNADAAAGEDRLFHKHPDWLKPLDSAPYAAFDISFDKSTYAFLTLGGLRTDAHARVLDAAGQPIAGLYAAGACAAQLPADGKEYASGLTLGPGSFFGREAGRRAAAEQPAQTSRPTAPAA
jgi:succinate dehydrogenase/fumarate reductase flavoprotein subunit